MFILMIVSAMVTSSTDSTNIEITRLKTLEECVTLQSTKSKQVKGIMSSDCINIDSLQKSIVFNINL